MDDLIKHGPGDYELGEFDFIRDDSRKRDGGEGRIWYTRCADPNGGRVVVGWSRTLREAVSDVRAGLVTTLSRA